MFTVMSVKREGGPPAARLGSLLLSCLTHFLRRIVVIKNKNLHVFRSKNMDINNRICDSSVRFRIRAKMMEDYK